MFKYLEIVLTIRLKKWKNLFLKKSNDYQKFIILCHPRTGSTLLHTYLNSHPHILSLGEFIGMDFKERLGGQSPIEYLQKEGFKPYGSHIKAVGFKYFYQYREISESEAVLKELQKMDDLKVIHLTRENTLRSLVSLKIAQKTAGWTLGQESRCVDKKVALDVSTLINELETIENNYKSCKELFNEEQILEVSYEEIISGKQAPFFRIEGHLGLHKKEVLKSVLKQQNPEPLEQLISNYEEVEELLKGSRWAV